MNKNKDGGVAPPMNISLLFHDSEDDDDCNSDKQSELNVGENQLLNIGNTTLNIRQFAYHQANANQVWPGTFTLAEFLINRLQPDYGEQDKQVKRYVGEAVSWIANNKETNLDASNKEYLLELGAATGALSLCIKMNFPLINIITSDIDDGGEVEENISFNFKQNDTAPVFHIPHTWGSSWDNSVIAADHSKMLISDASCELGVRYVIASDILLYVSAYPSLVDSLEQLFNRERSTIREFVMAWNRRIPQSVEFFLLMKDRGFRCHRYRNSCVYSFFTQASASGDEYLSSLTDNYP